MQAKELGQTIRELRRHQGWTLANVAAKLRISIPALSNIETGVTDPNLSRIEQIAHLFGLKTAELLSDQRIDPSTLTALARLNRSIQEREQEIMFLQKKIIELYDELHSSIITK